MKKRVALGVAAVILSNTIVGTTNAYSALAVNTADRNTITQPKGGDITGKEEIQSTEISKGTGNKITQHEQSDPLDQTKMKPIRPRTVPVSASIFTTQQ